MMDFYRGKFIDNGSCGYLLKPSFMRDGNLTLLINYCILQYIDIFLMKTYFFSITFEISNIAPQLEHDLIFSSLENTTFHPHAGIANEETKKTVVKIQVCFKQHCLALCRIDFSC